MCVNAKLQQICSILIMQKENRNRIMNLKQLSIIYTLIVIVINDCPIIPYPRNTIVNYIQAQFNNDPNLHTAPQQYTYIAQQVFIDSVGVNIATGVVGLQFNSHGIIDFSIQPKTSPNVNQIKFTVTVTDPANGWKILRFNLFASQLLLFQAATTTVNQFTNGTNPNKYVIYRPLQNFQNFQDNPNIKIFISGLKLKAKPLDDNYNTISTQFEAFKKFSANTQLITYFSQAVQQSKSLYFQINSTKLLGRILVVNIQTNCELYILKFSYILFNSNALTQKHQYIVGDILLINNNQYTFTPLQNMDMLFIGLSGMKVPRDKLFTSYISYSNYLGQAYIQLQSQYTYMQQKYSYYAFDMKIANVCDDCIDNSTIIYNNQYCVKSCPRGYSQFLHQNTIYCDKCDIEKLKIIDPITFNCVCAVRYYLNSSGDNCLPCSYDCMTCNTGNKCLTCDNSLLQTGRKLNNNNKCSCPSIGYYDDINAQNIVCQKCSSKCVSCDGPRDSDCLTCANGKELNGQGFCVCKNGYTEDSNSNCICVPPNTIVSNLCIDNSTICGNNQMAQFSSNGIKKCVCTNGYIQVLNSCIKCGANSTFDSNLLKCVCIKDNIMVNGNCVPCQNNKIYDSLTGICVCKPGTFKADDGSCVTCGVKMAYYNGKCNCIFNYYLSSNGNCVKCLLPTDGATCSKNIY